MHAAVTIRFARGTAERASLKRGAGAPPPLVLQHTQKLRVENRKWSENGSCGGSGPTPNVKFGLGIVLDAGPRKIVLHTWGGPLDTLPEHSTPGAVSGY